MLVIFRKGQIVIIILTNTHQCRSQSETPSSHPAILTETKKLQPTITPPVPFHDLPLLLLLLLGIMKCSQPRRATCCHAGAFPLLTRTAADSTRFPHTPLPSTTYLPVVRECARLHMISEKTVPKKIDFRSHKG